MTYAPAQARLTEPVWSPLHQREWLTSPLQLALLEAIGPDGYTGTLRDLAERVGYAGAGAVHHAIASLVTGGLVTVHTARGRHGGTRLRLRAGVRLIRRVAAILEGVRSLLSRMAGPRDPAAWWDTEPEEPEEPVPVATFGDRPTPAEPEEPEPGAGPFGTVRCACGRLRLTHGGEVAGPCTHGAGR